MSPGTLLLGLGALGVIAVFSAAEEAISSADRDGDDPRDPAVEALYERPGLLRAACGLGSALGAAALGLAGARLGAELADTPLLGLALAPLSLLAGRLGTGPLARAYASALASRLIGLVQGLARPLSPLVGLMERLVGLDGREGVVSREEIRQRIGGEQGGATRRADRAMIQRVFALSELSVRDVMVPLSAVDALPREATLAEAARRMIESGHSRLPVYKDRIDRTIGIVLHQDLLQEVDWSAPVTEILRPAYYVPQTKKVDQLFPELRRSRQRLAVAVDEYGGAVGILTVEDLLEQIVGDIEDESDRAAELVRPTGRPGEWLASGRATIGEVGRVTGARVPQGDYESIAGFVLTTLGRVPRPGERLSTDGLAITVTRASERAIQELLLRSTRSVRQGPGGGLR